MMQSTSSYQNFNSVTYFKNISDANCSNYKKQYSPQIVNLYIKYEDEPDFDCEFLKSLSNDHSENAIDIEYEEEYKDDYNDKQWEADLYDPYSESTYY